MSRSHWLKELSYVLGKVGSGICCYPINSIPELKKKMREKYDYAPSDLGMLEILESLAHFFEIPEARCFVRFESSLKHHKLSPLKHHKSLKRKISKEEIESLKAGGTSISQIAEIAGISKQRVSQILKK